MDAREEYDCLKKQGIKLNLNSLPSLEIYVLRKSQKYAYSFNMVDTRTDKPLIGKVDVQWV